MANFCTQCGKAVQPTANFYNTCGTKLLQSETGTISSHHKQVNFKDKQARVLGQQYTNTKPKYVLFGMFSAGIILGLLILFNSLPSRAKPVIENQPVVSESLQYPTSPK